MELEPRAGRAQRGEARDPAPVPERRQGAAAARLDAASSASSRASTRTIDWYREFLRDASSADELRRQILDLVAEYHDGRLRRPAVRPRRDADAGVGPGVRRRRAAVAWSMPRSTSGSPPAASPTSSSARFARVFGVRHAMLVNSGSSANLLARQRADVAEAGRAAAAARRRGDHRRRRLPDHGQPDPPERPRAGVRRRRRCRPTTSTSTQLEAALGAADARDHDRPHARQPVRPRRGHAPSPRRTTCGWSRTAATPSARPTTASTVGTFGDLATRQLLPRAPHHDGRGRLRAHRARRRSRRSSSRSATGAATAGASPARRTPAASASTGSSATCRTATTTSTSTRTSATT